MVLKLKLALECVGSGPGLGENQTVLLVGVLGLEVTINGFGGAGTSSSDFEDNVGGSLGFYFQSICRERIVLVEQVVGRLAKILKTF